LRPAALFWAVVPPWDELLRRVPEPDDLPPRLDAPGEFAIRAARSLDIPFSFSFSYCFSFFTLGRFPGMVTSFNPLLGRRPRRVVFLRIGSGRFVALFVPVVVARVHILVVLHEGAASRQIRT
jgi:hypothetical protein